LKIFFFFIVVFLILSCGNETDKSYIIEKCVKPSDCNDNFECKFNDLQALDGECSKRIDCEYSYECDNNRTCQKDYDLNKNFCGNNKRFSVFTKSLNNAYLYKEYFQKIELSYPQGEYFFSIIKGELPKGINLSKNGVLSGLADDEIKEYSFTIEVLNAPENSNIFYNYKKLEKEFTIKLFDNDPCNYKCNEYQICNNDNQTCEETAIPSGLTRIYTENNDIYQGNLISVYDHSKWWWDSSDEFTYALFIEDGFQNTGDRSVMIISSYQINKIETSSNYLSIENYLNFLKTNNFLLKLPFNEEVFVIEGNEGYHKEESGYGDFAYDFVINDVNENNFQNDGLNNEDYYIYNKPVYLPIEATVFEIHDNHPDNVPGEYIDESEANMLGVKLNGNYYVYLLHLKENSIPMLENNNCERDINDVKCIKVGDVLEEGTYIGRVGNSGVSLLPHLHLTMFVYDINNIDNVRMWSIPSLFKNLEQNVNGELSYYDFYQPKTGDYLKNNEN